MQINRSLLPKVFPSHSKKGWGFYELADKYRELPKETLIIGAVMATSYMPTAGADTLHLDGILSQAVITSHPCSFKYNDACVIPLPIKMLWVSESGLPLWASTDMVVVGNKTQSRDYWHKRYPSHRSDFGIKMNANTSAGKNKEYRVPMNAVNAENLKAIIVGNKTEIERLLEYTTHIGKKGSIGYGRVAKWTVESDVIDDIESVIVAGKSVPVEYIADKDVSGKYMPSTGWTPPYWYAPNHTACICP